MLTRMDGCQHVLRRARVATVQTELRLMPFVFVRKTERGGPPEADLERVLDTTIEGGLTCTGGEPFPPTDVPARVSFVLENPGQQWRYTSDLHADYIEWFATAWTTI